MSAEQKEDLMKRVDQALETVRPHLAVDGGNVEVVDITDDMTVKVKWMGSCQSCSMSEMTMKAGLEQAVMGQIPEITKIEAVNGLNGV